jgi:hypothetical protein
MAKGRIHQPPESSWRESHVLALERHRAQLESARAEVVDISAARARRPYRLRAPIATGCSIRPFTPRRTATAWAVLVRALRSLAAMFYL